MIWRNWAFFEDVPVKLKLTGDKEMARSRVKRSSHPGREKSSSKPLSRSHSNGNTEGGSLWLKHIEEEERSCQGGAGREGEGSEAGVSQRSW